MAERFGKQLTPDVLAVKKGGTGLGAAPVGSVLAANVLDTYTSLTSVAGTKVLKNIAGVISWGDLSGLTTSNHILDDHSDTIIDGTWDPATGYTLLGVELADNEFLAYDTATHRFINQTYTEAGFGTVYSYNVGILHNQVALLNVANQFDYTLLPIFIGDNGVPGNSVPGIVPVAAVGDLAAGKFLNAGGTWAVPAGAGGEANTASNVGGHAIWFKQKVAADLEFKTVQSSDGSVSITENASDIDIVVDTSVLPPTIDHNALANIQGFHGTYPLSDEAYHLSNAQHDALTDAGGIDNADSQHTHSISSFSPEALTKGNGIVYSVGATYDTTVAVTISLDYEVGVLPAKAASPAIFGVATTVSRSDHVHLVNAFSELSDTNFVGLANLEIAQFDIGTGKWINVAPGTALAYTGGDGIDITGTVIKVDFEPTNLRITGAALLNTIQNIDVTASPTFVGMTLSGFAGDVGKFVEIAAGGALIAGTPPTSYWTQGGGFLYNTALLTENVGIGIANPSTQLELKGDFSFTEDLARNLYVQKRSTLGDGYGFTIYADEAGDGVGSYTGGNLVLISGAGSGTGGTNVSGKIAIYGGTGDSRGDVYLNRDIVGAAIGNVFLGIVDTDNTEDDMLVVTTTGEIKKTSKATIIDTYWERVIGGTNYLIPKTVGDSIKIGGIGVPTEIVEIEGNIVLSKGVAREFYVAAQTANSDGDNLAIAAADANDTLGGVVHGGNVHIKGGDTTTSGLGAPAGGSVYLYGGGGDDIGEVYIGRDESGIVNGGIFLGLVGTDDVTDDVLVMSSTGLLSKTSKAGFAGTTTFIALTDTPGGWSGKAGWLLQANSVPDALEFIQTISDDQHGQRSFEDSSSNLLHPVFGTGTEGFVPGAPILVTPGTYLRPNAIWGEMKNVLQDATVIDWRYGLVDTPSATGIYVDVEFDTTNLRITGADLLNTIQNIDITATPEFVSTKLTAMGTVGEVVVVGIGKVLESQVIAGTDQYVAIYAGQTPGYIGANHNDGVLRVDSTITYACDVSGDFITLSIDPTNHVHTFLLLSDVDETTYVGHAGYLTHVNVGETDLEFVEPSSIGVGLWLRNTIPVNDSTYLANLTDYVGLGMNDPEEKLEIDGNIVFSENVDRTIGLLQRTSAVGVGKGYNLTVSAGKALHSIADQIGGDLILKAGRGSGAAPTGGNVYIYGGGDIYGDVKIGITETGPIGGELYIGTLSSEIETTHLVGWDNSYKIHSVVGSGDGQYLSWDHPNLKWVLHAAPAGGTVYWEISGGNLRDTIAGGGTYIASRIDFLTDRWLSTNPEYNTFLGVGIVGAGNLSHVAGVEGHFNIAFGYDSLYNITTGSDNVAIGSRSLYTLTTGKRILAIGSNAGRAITNSIEDGILIGYNSGYNNASPYNVFIGNDSGYQVDGQMNIGIGNYSLYGAAVSSDAAYNIGIGYYSLTSISEGDYNVGMGVYSLKNLTTGDYNVGIGYNSLYQTTTAFSNIAIGHEALLGKIANTATRNTVMGYEAGKYIDADDNIFVGYQSGKGDGVNYVTGDYNIGIGNYSLYSLTTSTENTAIGYESLKALTTGNGANTVIGYQAGLNNVIGTYNTLLGNGAGEGLAASSFSNCTLIGYESGKNNTVDFNMGIGSQALLGAVAGITGTHNIGIGKNTLTYVAGGGYNVAIGSNACNADTSGKRNTAIGYQALNFNQSGDSNVAIGYQSLYGKSVNSVDYNTILGTYAGRYVNSNENIFIGYQAGLGDLVNHVTGGCSIGIGTYSLTDVTSGAYNLSLGYKSAFVLTTGGSNVLLGNTAGYSLTTEAEKLRISTTTDGSTEKCLIDGDFNSNWCRINDILILNPLAAAPMGGSEIEGMIYTDTNHHIYYWNGTAWKQLDN